MMMTLREAAVAMRGDLLPDSSAEDLWFEAVSTDSRTAKGGVLFIALVGERFDAHDFVAEVGRAGAVAAVVARSKVERLGEVPLPIIAVDDTRLALGRLAATWRQRFRIPVLAVTGSNGKTTTKEMIASILKAQAVHQGGVPESVLATQGNLNNDIGLPLTLLSLREHHRFAVVELGMNHPGEIAYLADIARPDAGLVINALRAHLEGLGSVEGVAREKGSLFEHLSPSGCAVIAADSEFEPLWKAQAGSARPFLFSLEGRGDLNGEATLEALGVRLTLTSKSGMARIFLQAPGRHNAQNAVAAAAICLAAGCDMTAIERGLSVFSGVKGRLQQKRGSNGALVIDDTYNANPDSVRAAIDVLAGLDGVPQKLLVLGDMGETGSDAQAYHQEIGRHARLRGIDALFALGELSVDTVRAFGDGARHFATPEAVADAVRQCWTPESVVLVKGSRFMRMERVVALLEGAGQNNTNKGAATCC